MQHDHSYLFVGGGMAAAAAATAIRETDVASVVIIGAEAEGPVTRAMHATVGFNRGRLHSTRQNTAFR